MLAHVWDDAAEIDPVCAQGVIRRRGLCCKEATAIETIFTLLTVLKRMSDAFLLRRSSESVESKLLVESLQRCSGKVDSEMLCLCLSIPTDSVPGVNRTFPKSFTSRA